MLHRSTDFNDSYNGDLAMALAFVALIKMMGRNAWLYIFVGCVKSNILVDGTVNVEQMFKIVAFQCRFNAGVTHEKSV